MWDVSALTSRIFLESKFYCSGRSLPRWHFIWGQSELLYKRRPSNIANVKRICFSSPNNVGLEKNRGAFERYAFNSFSPDIRMWRLSTERVIFIKSTQYEKDNVLPRRWIYLTIFVIKMAAHFYTDKANFQTCCQKDIEYLLLCMYFVTFAYLLYFCISLVKRRRTASYASHEFPAGYGRSYHWSRSCWWSAPHPYHDQWFDQQEEKGNQQEKTSLSWFFSSSPSPAGEGQLGNHWWVKSMLI